MCNLPGTWRGLTEEVHRECVAENAANYGLWEGEGIGELGIGYRRVERNCCPEIMSVQEVGDPKIMHHLIPGVHQRFVLEGP